MIWTGFLSATPRRSRSNNSDLIDPMPTWRDRESVFASAPQLEVASTADMIGPRPSQISMRVVEQLGPSAPLQRLAQRSADHLKYEGRHCTAGATDRRAAPLLELGRVCPLQGPTCSRQPTRPPVVVICTRSAFRRVKVRSAFPAGSGRSRAISKPSMQMMR